MVRVKTKKEFLESGDWFFSVSDSLEPVLVNRIARKRRVPERCCGMVLEVTGEDDSFYYISGDRWFKDCCVIVNSMQEQLEIIKKEIYDKGK